MERERKKGRQANKRFSVLCTIQARLRILHKSLRHVSGASDCRRSTTAIVSLVGVLFLGVVLGVHRWDIVASGPAPFGIHT